MGRNEVLWMGIVLPQTVKVNVGSRASYYESLGYKIPRYYNEKKRGFFIKNGTTLDISVEDLKRNSTYKIECECDICKQKEIISMVEYTRINKMLQKYDYEYLCLDCKFDVMPTAKINVGTFKNNPDKIKEFLIRKLKAYIEKNGYPAKKREVFKPENNLPSLKMYENYIGGSLSDWIELCGYNISDNEKYDIQLRGRKKDNLTKDRCIQIIFNMQSKLDRPLMYDDFRNPTKDTIGITYINKYWGSLNKMKQALGLDIIQESMMDKHLEKDQFDNIIEQIALDLSNSNKNFITTREINLNKQYPNYWTLDKSCRNYYNIGLVEHASKYNIYFGKQGHGINYDFDDGEHTTSQFEYIFSNYLKHHGFIYNKDYFRDVKYSSFIEDCTTNQNCDYVLYVNNSPVYIEIAGILQGYKEWYYSDKKISSSKSKEKYRVKLKQKESMLKYSNLKYFILFPCDLTTENFDRIINNPTLKLKHEIELFNINNIDWIKVREIGELDYSKDVIRTDFNHKKVS